MHDIIDLSVELAVYRKGSLLVCVNFDQGIMIWRDSRQWCNNFIRSISNEQIDEIREVLAKSGLIEAIGENGCDRPEPGSCMTPETAGRSGEQQIERRASSLRLSLMLADGPVSVTGESIDPAIRNILVSQIEKLSRIPFRL